MAMRGLPKTVAVLAMSGVFVSAWGVAGASAAQGGKKPAAKKPGGPPKAVSPAEAAKQLRMLFGRDMERVGSTVDKADDAALAAKMLATAKTIKDNAALRSLLCQKAYELGIRHPSGYAAAAGAMKLLVQADPASSQGCREKLLKVLQLQFTVARGIEKRQVGQDLMKQLITVGDANAAAGEWSKADAHYRRALGLAGMLRSPEKKGILHKIQQAKSARQAQAREALLKSKLAKNPADAAARAELIRYYVGVCDKPAEAAKILRSDVDERLRTYVPLAARPVGEVPPKACLELAQWYHGFLAGAAGPLRTALLKRTQGYYQRYLSAGKGETAGRIKAKMELARITKELARIAVSPNRPVPLAGAVLVMTFNEDCLFKKSGRTCVRDLSGRGNHGVLVGAVQVAGKAGQAVGFNGVNSYVVMANSASLQTTGSQTICFWLRQDKGIHSALIFSKLYSAEGAILLSAGGMMSYHYGPGSGGRYAYQQRLEPARQIPRGKWIHVACVRDMRRERLRCYFNGSLVAEEGTDYDSIKPSRGGVYLGRNPTSKLSNPAFKGELDEFVIYARPLSQTEIKTLHDLGRRGKSLR